MFNEKKIALLIAGVCAVAVIGCGKESPKPMQKAQDTTPTIVPVKNFKPDLPENFRSLSISDAKITGLCYLDAVNSSALGDKQKTIIKAGEKLSLGGWAVYDVNPATLGTAFAVQLFGNQSSYYSMANSYNRKGLGAALGNEKLDDGGLNLDMVSLDIPVGTYKVLFLTQSGNNLLRCDTGHTISVE